MKINNREHNIIKYICYFPMMLFIFTITSLGAIVSDSDGNAFVQKQEFEKLKEDLNSQLERYNVSIDSKIDGAIASYISGTQIGRRVKINSLLNEINDVCGDSYMDGTTEKKYNYRCMAKSYVPPLTQEPKGAIVGAFLHKGMLNGNSSEFKGGWMRVGLNYQYRGQVGDVQIPSGDVKNGLYLLMDQYNNKFTLTNEYANVLYRYYVIGNAGAHNSNQFPSGSDTWSWNFSEFKNENNFWSIGYGTVSCGFSTASPTAIKYFFGPTYEMSKSINVLPICGKIEGTAYGLENDKIKNMTLQNSSYSWNWYPATGTYIWRKVSGSWTSYTITNSPVSSTFYFNCHPYQQITLSDLIDYNATRIYGNGNVAIYGGLPICNVSNKGVLTIKISFKSVSGNDVYVGLNKTQFKNDDTNYSIQNDLNLRNENDVKYTTNKFRVNEEYVFKIDVEKNDVIWIKTCDSSSDTGFTGAVTSDIELVTE